MNEFFATISSVNRFSFFPHILVHFSMLSVCLFLPFFISVCSNTDIVQRDGQTVILQLRRCTNPTLPFLSFSLFLNLYPPLPTWCRQKDTFVFGIFFCPHVSCFMFLVSLLSFYPVSSFATLYILTDSVQKFSLSHRCRACIYFIVIA